MSNPTGTSGYRKPINVKATIAMMEDWFWAIERGEERLPNPYDKSVSIEQANELVEYIDAFCEHQLRYSRLYWETIGMESKGKPIDTSPEFKRMSPAMRIAFAQAFYQAKQKKIEGLSYYEEHWGAPIKRLNI